MDDLQFLSPDSIDNQVQGALGYKPKQSKTTDANLGNIRPVGSNTEFLQTPTREQGIKDIDSNLLAYGTKHGINTLRGVISRWAPASENDTKSYVDTVSKRLSLDPDQKIDLTDPAIRHLIGAGIMLQEKGPQSIYKTQAQTQPQAQTQQPTDDLDPLKFLSGANVDLAVQSALKAKPEKAQSNLPAYKQTFNKLEEQSKDSFGNKYVMPAAETAVSLATGATTGLLSGVISGLVPGSKEYEAKRKAEWKKLNPNLEYIKAEQDFIEGVQRGTILPKSARGQEMLEKVGGALSWIPPAIAPELTALSSSTNPVLAAKMAARARKVEPGVTTIVAPEVEKAAQISSADTPTYLRQKFAQKQAAEKPLEQTIVEPVATTKPYAGNVEIPVPEEIPVRLEKPVDVAKAAETEKLLRDVGIERVRLSALNEDPLESSSQYITSKAEKGPYGAGMREQIAHEKSALENHFGKIESELGGTIPKDIVDEINRGKTVKNALEEAQANHAAETGRLYKKATEEIGGAQVGLNDFQSYLNKESNFVHGPEQNLRSGVRAYLKEQELMDKEGNISPMTVEQSENLRKFINSQYNYETKNKVGNLVNTIDNDVFKNVQGKTYEEARAHFKKGREIYDNPKAIKDLLKDEGVNQKVADEKVMTKITTLDQSQFEHLVDTLRATGKEDALKEIQTNLVNRIKEAGRSEELEPWNSRAAAKERVKLSAKLQKAFEGNPDQLERINKGIAAGNKIYIPTRYPGAAVQKHLLHTKFGDIAVKAGTYLGAKMGGGVGAVFGENMGARAAERLAKNKQTKQLEKEIKQTKLSDIGKEQK